MTSVSRQGIAADMRPVSCVRQDSGTSWETVFSWLILRSISTDTVHPGMVLLCCRHSSPSGVPAAQEDHTGVDGVCGYASQDQPREYSLPGGTAVLPVVGHGRHVSCSTPPPHRSHPASVTFCSLLPSNMLVPSPTSASSVPGTAPWIGLTSSG